MKFYRSTAFMAALSIATAFVSSVNAQQPDAKVEKKLTGQRLKFKDCAIKWKDAKTSGNLKGRAAYNKFMSGCLKG